MQQVEKTKKSKKPRAAYLVEDAGSADRKMVLRRVVPKLPPELQEKATDSPALKRARAGFLETLRAPHEQAIGRLAASPGLRKAFNEYRVPRAPTLAQAKEAFDAAGVECMVACLSALAEANAQPHRAVDADEASFATLIAGANLSDAYAAILRARDAAPIALTAKGEMAQTKDRPYPASRLARCQKAYGWTS